MPSKRPRLSSAQQRVVDAMLDGEMLQWWGSGNASLSRHIPGITVRALERLGAIESCHQGNGETLYRLAPEWQDKNP